LDISSEELIVDDEFDWKSFFRLSRKTSSSCESISLNNIRIRDKPIRFLSPIILFQVY